MPPRYQDWLKQAERDFKAAQDSLRAGNYEWAVFQSIQAAEKALKAVLLFCGFLSNLEAIRAARYTFIVLIEAATNIANHLCAR